ncbi:hypothetical protein LTR62_004424 [Meristemomyces frigidus]|uniref:C3H1-type domain-containing protein n=1 Tax=Meristemomyces frigidus TaxID=1508187 RepID=A0AAN7YK09_9PEZI|nr:hypothetical protein LTR62_004424 [Meristemomyces frigidus]
MVYVDWEGYGICKFYMLGGRNSCQRAPCRWKHPPASEVCRLWDFRQAREDYVNEVKPPPPVSESQPEILVSGVKAHALQELPRYYSPEDRIAQLSQHDGANSLEEYFADAPPKAEQGLQTAPARQPKNTSTNDEKLDGSYQARTTNNMPKNANHEPLGKTNRLLPTPANSSSPLVEFPSANARTVRRRTEDVQVPVNHAHGMAEGDDTPPKKSRSWEKRHELEKLLVGKEKSSEVGTEQAGVQSTSSARDMPPPPLPPNKLSTIKTAVRPPPVPYRAETTDDVVDMGAIKRMSNGDPKPIGPHPSTITVSARYLTQNTIEKRLHPPSALDIQERSLAEAREDSVRLQGVTWLDNTRRALQLPIRTFTTACAYYHRFRLAHPNAAEYNWADAAAAALLASCKAEDTLKKSRDILAAAYNLKAGGGAQDPLSADDVVFEAPSRVVIGLERLMLESSGFDFRAKYPHALVVKICKSLSEDEEKRKVGEVAWTVATDLHRTFASLKQTTATMALACVELAAKLYAASTGREAMVEQVDAINLGKWSTTREEIMETSLDLLDLYTHHTASTILGTKYSLDDFLQIRLALNKESNTDSIARFTSAPERISATDTTTLSVANGHPTPVSPPQPGTQTQQQSQQVTNAPQMPGLPEGGGTLRFMLDPRFAADEKAEVAKFYTQEWEEYDEEIEVPLPKPPRSVARSRSRDRHSNRGSSRHERPADRSHPPPHRHARDSDRRNSIEDRRPPPVVDERRSIDQHRSREELRERDRERDRDRTRERERDRDYDRDFERDRYDRRERDRYDDRGRYDDRERYGRRSGGGGAGRYGGDEYRRRERR